MDQSGLVGRLSVIGGVVVLVSGVAILIGEAGRLTVVMGAVGLLFLTAAAYIRRFGVPGR